MKASSIGPCKPVAALRDRHLGDGPWAELPDVALAVQPAFARNDRTGPVRDLQTVAIDRWLLIVGPPGSGDEDFRVQGQSSVKASTFSVVILGSPWEKSAFTFAFFEVLAERVDR